MPRYVTQTVDSAVNSFAMTTMCQSQKASENQLYLAYFIFNENYEPLTDHVNMED